MEMLGRTTLRLESDFEMPTDFFNWDFALFVVFGGRHREAGHTRPSPRRRNFVPNHGACQDEEFFTLKSFGLGLRRRPAPADEVGLFGFFGPVALF